MGLDIYFIEDVANRLTALHRANSRAMTWARDFGADPRDVAIAETAYQAALLDVGVSFGLQRADLVMIMGALSHSELTTRKCHERQPR